MQLYDLLQQTNYSPGVRLNRVFALYKARGREVALAEALKLDLADNHFYFVLLGELYTAVDREQAILHFQQAWSLAKTQSDKQTIQEKMDHLRS
ncbi:hypothetical protein [Paraflavitalea speifideaquila]|uniref:hypothetical protein n=1 Tax=Paraflavitalea speifideaquila TaxID=3076558 RepID=UPI0028EB1F6B|nr:hypothetical protein [Paraflavitalea speifideiaquila]